MRTGSDSPLAHWDRHEIDEYRFDVTFDRPFRRSLNFPPFGPSDPQWYLFPRDKKPKSNEHKQKQKHKQHPPFTSRLRRPGARLYAC